MKKSYYFLFFIFVFVLGLKSIHSFGQTTLPSDYFRSFQSGAWDVAANWESSPNGSTNWITSSLAPTSDANTITVRSGHSVTISNSITTDQVVVASGGILELATVSNPGLTINDGSGNDIIVQNGGVFKHNIASTSSLPSFATPSATLEIQSGGILEAANNTGTPSNYANTGSAIASNVLWADGAIFKWNNTESPASGVTYFPDNPAIPIFRFSKSASIGGTEPTVINGLLEAIADVSFSSSGTKTFRNGITGTGKVAVTSSSVGKLIINGPTAIFGGPATGTLKTGSYTPVLSTKDKGYTFIGNPYASPVDFEKMINYNTTLKKVTGTANNIKPEYTVWDPKLSRRGAYVTYNSVTGKNNDTSEVNQNIQPGQAVFVQTIGNNSSPAIEFRESYKSAGITHVFRNPNQIPKLSVQLLLNLNGGLENTADGVTAFFDDEFATGIGNEDSYKFTNLDENLAIDRNETALSMEGRPSVTVDDTLPLTMWQFRQQSYYLRLTGINFSATVTAFVKDKYLHRETPVDLASVTLLPFTIDTTLPPSFVKDRFSIVFKTINALPVTLTNVKAYQKDKGIQVDWIVQGEINIGRYEVEESLDGQNFDKAAIINARGSNAAAQNYNWFDVSPNPGHNFYRIKTIEKTGAVKYSEVVRVNIAEGNSSITVFPNPIKENLVKVHFNNMEKGRYLVTLYNLLGQTIYRGAIEHAGSSGIQTILLSRSISKGTYTLQVTKENVIMKERVIVE